MTSESLSSGYLTLGFPPPPKGAKFFYCFGQLKAQLEQAGETIADLDLQIASIALDQNAALVTHHHKHFARLTDLAGLVLEDWL